MASDPARSGPKVSVIVPARNEEASLGACLASITRQTGTSFEVIVVDDGSSDRTREIAGSFPGVRVVDPDPLPKGWTGKNNALVAGAKQAGGEWLLFTDADTVHLPGSLAQSLAEAAHRGAAIFSYSPEQEVHGFWQRAVMPVIFAELACTYRPRDVCDPMLPAAAANGQYLLVSREAYDRVGGHAAIATDILEDVALARAVKQSGGKTVLLFGLGAVRTRMYRNFAQLREGWTKNLVLLFPETRKFAVLRAGEFAVIVAGAGIAISAALKGRTALAMVATGAAAAFYFIFVKRIRKAHFGWLSNPAAFFGLPVFSYLLLRSRLSYKRGAVEWKGRSYAPRVASLDRSKTGAQACVREGADSIHQAKALR
jgi:glycosyltransferase involved in cell wall biosynthesis